MKDHDGINDAFYDGTEIPIGQVVRMRSDATESGADESPFSDSVVIGVRDGYVEIARPYAYASTIGICHNVLLGCERVKIDEALFRKRYYRVLTSRQNPHIMSIR